jgi:hypothetical protein
LRRQCMDKWRRQRGADDYLWGYVKGVFCWKTANKKDELCRLIEATAISGTEHSWIFVAHREFLVSQGSATHYNY